jgi:hypothetical protein
MWLVRLLWLMVITRTNAKLVSDLTPLNVCIQTILHVI